MKPTEILQRFEETANQYLNELDGFSMEQLKCQPGSGEWSLGQMYVHLINSALHMQLHYADLCLAPNEATASSAGGGKTKEGMGIFELGGFPPVRVQVPPSPQYTPEQPESKEQLIEGLNLVIDRMKDIMPRLEHAVLGNTMPHPRFGALHAREWFWLVEMHYRHHLLQMGRLKDFLAV